MYVVDGNNLMGQTPGWHRNRAASKRRLLGRLASFAAAKGLEISVVFDGRPEPELPNGAHFRGIKVFYSGTGLSADSLIEQMVRSASEPSSIIVVTSDKRLIATVRALGAAAVRSGEFRRHMERCGY
jgi:predicted RNA-binding protein with PIN domain